MNNILKPASFLMYFLVILNFFFIGAAIAAISGVAEGQGLAGGAIVFSYGVMFAGIALVISFFLAYRLTVSKIIQLNKYLALLFAVIIIIFSIRLFQQNQQSKIEQMGIQFEETEESLIVPAVIGRQQMQTIPIPEVDGLATESLSSLGIWQPNFSEIQTLYFYTQAKPDKSITDQKKVDSISFSKTSYGQYEIKTAPPWLAPEYMKMDYDALLFKVVSIGLDYIELEVNKFTQQTAIVHRWDGNLISWSEFILSVHSVEFNEKSDQNIYIKPLENASLQQVSYQYLKPLKIKHDWLYVALQNEKLETLGYGWILWMKDGNVIINYLLFS